VNEYAMTVLLEDHRRELLAEAENEALARLYREGHEPWWRRLVRRSTDAPVDRTTSLSGHLAAPPVMNAH